MASFGSTIDDPEKHFLGDLLADDDAQQPASPNRSSASSVIPPAAVISGTGPVSSSFWPEPPPPYSASVNAPSWLPSGNVSAHTHHSTFNHVLQQPLKEPAEFDSFFMAGTSPPVMQNFNPVHPQHQQYGAHYRSSMKPPPHQQRNNGYSGHQQPTYPHPQQLSLHHHPQQNNYLQQHGYVNVQPNLQPLHMPNVHHDFRHEQAMGNFVQRSDSPEEAPACPTPPDLSSMTYTTNSRSSSSSNNSMRYSAALQSSSTTTCNSPSRAAERSAQITPPPPEPIHKLPFSYRDVAGRCTSTISVVGGKQNAQQRNSAPVTPVSDIATLPIQKPRLGSASSAMSESNIRTESVDAYFKDKRRRGLDNEFQKITRKKGQTKADKLQAMQADANSIDGASRWDVLQTLSPRRDTRESDAADMEANKQPEPTPEPVVPQAVRRGSRSSSVEDPSEEVERAVSTNSKRATQPNVGKKKAVEQSIPQMQMSSKKTKAGKRGRNDSVVSAHVATVASLIISLLDVSFRWLFSLLSDILLSLSALTAHSACVTFVAAQNWFRQTHILLVNKCSNGVKFVRHMDWKRVFSLRRGPSDDSGKWGLEHNIELPSTGKEAIDRLMRCDGQDAYVILGVRADCSDDEIKKHYKKQSLLIHPDKNPSECAHEAFRVLHKAYEMVGRPEDRNRYDLVNINKNPMHAELEELWEKLREKVREAQSTMFCDCGEKHMRVLVENVRQTEARWCARCRLRHPAKNNDIWAESRLFGFFWVYFTCDEGQIYDISQWATCEHNQLKHLRANSHSVQYRLTSSSPTPANLAKMSQTLSTALHNMTKGPEPLLTREDARVLQEAAQCAATFRPPDRSGEDRPRKANNRRQRKR